MGGNRCPNWPAGMFLRSLCNRSFGGVFVWSRCYLDFSVGVFFSSHEPKARVSYCHSATSVVRPSYVRRKLLTFSTSSPKALDGFWWNLVGMKYSWSLTSVVAFRQDPPRGGSRAGQNSSWGSPSSTNFFFRREGYSNKPNA